VILQVVSFNVCILHIFDSVVDECSFCEDVSYKERFYISLIKPMINVHLLIIVAYNNSSC